MSRADRHPPVVHARHHVGPTWPPSVTAYDYVLNLCWSDLAWEFLRRNPSYQRDWQLNRKGIAPPRRLASGTLLTRIRRHCPRAHHWSLHAFVDPTWPAPHAPLCWSQGTALQFHAVAQRPSLSASVQPLVLDRNTADHIVIGPDGNETLVLRNSELTTTLHTAGARVAIGPASVTLLINDFTNPARTAAALSGLAAHGRRPRARNNHTRERLLLRDALIDLDGRCFGASYRYVAGIIHGTSRAQAAWASASTAPKEHLRRARAKGQALRDGGYFELLERGCRFAP